MTTTFKQLQDVEEKGRKVFATLDEFSTELQQQLGVLDIKKDLNLFASGKPCYILKKPGFFGSKVFYVRNVITNPRQPSPVFVRIFDKQHEQIILAAISKYQGKIEAALGVKITLSQEEKV